MNADLGKTLFTPEEIDDLRDRLKNYKDKHKLSWADLSTATGIPQGTLSTWVPGGYNGGKIYENQSLPGFAYRFFLGMAEREALEAVLPAEPDFQMTISARRMSNCLALAHMGDMALISSAPGSGKTATLIQYQATRPQVWLSTMSPSRRGVNTMLIAILASMGERDAKGTPQALSDRVVARVRGADALIVVDEAQHLSAQAFDELRSIHDQTGCGVALVGDETLAAALKKYPQLYSRLGIRHSQPRPLNEDVAAVGRAWGVEKGPELAFLQDIGRRGGGLRTITKTLKLAIRAARAGGAPLDIADLKDAYAQRYGDQG